jgi:hypothetical protein
VKNFTNFACGIGGCPITFRRHSGELVSSGRFLRRRLAEVTVSCNEKTTDGEETLNSVSMARGRWFVGKDFDWLTNNKCQRFSQSGPTGCR